MKRWATERLLQDPALRRRAKEWCWENGVDPTQVPCDGQVHELDGKLELEVIRYGDPSRGSRFLLVEPVSPIPEDLLD